MVQTFLIYFLELAQHLHGVARTHHTGRHRHALIILLCWIQHAQKDGKVPVLVIDDRKWQLICRLITIVSIDVLEWRRKGKENFKPDHSLHFISEESSLPRLGNQQNNAI